MKKIVPFVSLLPCVLSVGFSAPTPSPEQVPSSVLSSRIQQALQADQPKKLPKAQLTVQKEKAKPSQASSRAAKVEVKINQVKFDGNDMPLPAKVQALVDKLKGQTLSLAAVQQTVQAMQQVYRSEGYILTQLVLPPQKLSKQGATLQIKVVEGYIAHVQLKGDDPLTGMGQLQDYIDNIKASKPLNIKVLEQNLMLANEIPGLDIKSTLVPSKTVPGAADLVLNVQADRVSGYVSFNNRGSEYIGPQQLLAGVSLNRIFGADQLNFNYATSLPQAAELTNVGGSYDIQLGPYGTQLNVGVTYTQTKPGSGLSDLQLHGHSYLYQATITQPIIERRALQLSANLGMYHTDSRNLFPQFDNELLFHDRITAIKLGVDGAFRQGQSWNQADFTLTQGVPLNAPVNPARPSRVDGTARFTKLELSLTRTQYLPYNFALVLGTKGQFTNQHLLSSEQLGFGGQTFGQAYDSSAFTGDKGILGRVQLQYTAPQGLPWLPVLQPYVYYDIGKVWNNINDPSVMNNQSGASAGGGVNFATDFGVQASLTVAKPLTMNASSKNNRDVRFFFTVSLVG